MCVYMSTQCGTGEPLPESRPESRLEGPPDAAPFVRAASASAPLVGAGGGVWACAGGLAHSAAAAPVPIGSAWTLVCLEGGVMPSPRDESLCARCERVLRRYVEVV